MKVESVLVIFFFKNFADLKGVLQLNYERMVDVCQDVPLQLCSHSVPHLKKQCL